MKNYVLHELIRYQPEKMAKVDVVSSSHLICGLNCFEPGQSQKVHAHAGAEGVGLAGAAHDVDSAIAAEGDGVWQVESPAADVCAEADGDEVL